MTPTKLHKVRCTVRTFQELLGLKYGRATKLLLALEAKNKLRIVKVGQTNFYYPGPTLYN